MLREHEFRGRAYWTTKIGVRTYYSFDLQHWDRTFTEAAHRAGAREMVL